MHGFDGQNIQTKKLKLETKFKHAFDFLHLKFVFSFLFLPINKILVYNISRLKYGIWHCSLYFCVGLNGSVMFKRQESVCGCVLYASRMCAT